MCLGISFCKGEGRKGSIYFYTHSAFYHQPDPCLVRLTGR